MCIASPSKRRRLGRPELLSSDDEGCGLASDMRAVQENMRNALDVERKVRSAPAGVAS
jgi:hypothetical protein